MRLDGSVPHLVVFDIDGTLLDSRGRIFPSTRWSTRHLLASGHHVALASARPPKSVERLLRELLGNRIVDIISLNGAFVTSRQDVLLEHTIDKGAAEELIRQARARGVQTNLLSGWDWWVEEVTPRTQLEADIVGFEPTKVTDLTTLSDVPSHKLLFIADPEEVAPFRDGIWRSGLPVEAALSKPTYCEVVARGVSKAGAVTFLAQRFGTDPKNTVVFGDGENDLPMITAAGVGVAMGNSMDNVKQAAKLTTHSNDGDGIARALVRLGLVEG